jgi:hypothetical protein
MRVIDFYDIIILRLFEAPSHLAISGYEKQYVWTEQKRGGVLSTTLDAGEDSGLS